MAEYGVVCANLSHDYREAVGFNLRRNKAGLVKRVSHDKINNIIYTSSCAVSSLLRQVESSRHVTQVPKQNTWQRFHSWGHCAVCF